MPVSEEIEKLTVKRASSTEVKQVARAEGMEDLRSDGLAKTVFGHTSVEEVLRVAV